jgi:uncharacterized RDD family membrane protein YckC
MSAAAPISTQDSSAKPVGVFRRLGAMFYDSLLLLAMWFMGMAIALLFSHGEAIVGNPLVTTWLFLIAFAYFAFPWMRGGQTLGMKTWRFRLVRIDGKPLTLWHVLLRFLSAIPSIGLAGIGLWWAWSHPQRLALHDRFSETKLVRA